ANNKHKDADIPPTFFGNSFADSFIANENSGHPPVKGIIEILDDQDEVVDINHGTLGTGASNSVQVLTNQEDAPPTL
ncbi:unnamed protein product, partial [Brassica rapa subsp. trilocularis]